MRFIRTLLKEKQQILISILVGLFILVCIYTINALIANNNKENLTTENTTNTNYTYAESKQLDSAIGVSDEIDKEAKKTYKDTVSKFLDYCNSKDIDNAYSMLSSDCKEIVFNNDVNRFKENYVNTLFDSKKSYLIQNWVDNIFKISIKEDLITTGGVSNTEKQEYISVINSGKINVSGFIGSQLNGKSYTLNGVKISVLKKYSFMEYEIYNIKIENNSDENILLDDLSNSKNMYISDSNNIKYYSTTTNLNQVLLTANSGETKTINIRFNNPYISSRVIKKIAFTGIKKLSSNTKFGMEITI